MTSLADSDPGRVHTASARRRWMTVIAGIGAGVVLVALALGLRTLGVASRWAGAQTEAVVGLVLWLLVWWMLTRSRRERGRRRADETRRRGTDG